MRKYWENITDWRSVRFQYVFVQFWYVFGRIWYVFGRRKWFCTCCVRKSVCTKCVREKRISLHLSSISFNREKKRLFEKKRYGEFIFRIWNDSSQVPTKKISILQKIHFFTFREKNQISGVSSAIFSAFSLLVFFGKFQESYLKWTVLYMDVRIKLHGFDPNWMVIWTKVDESGRLWVKVQFRPFRPFFISWPFIFADSPDWISWTVHFRLVPFSRFLGWNFGYFILNKKTSRIHPYLWLPWFLTKSAIFETKKKIRNSSYT